MRRLVSQVYSVVSLLKVITLWLYVHSTRPVRFGIALPCTFEDKENARPNNDADNESDGSGDGPVLYRDDDDTDSAYGKLSLLERV